MKSIYCLFIFALSLSLAIAEKPNVIVIMLDDLGYQDLGFQGSPDVKTPHLDSLAESGVIFTDAHVAASVCAPSRAGFILGRYHQATGFEANMPSGQNGLDPKAYVMPQAFKDVGYRTYCVGKWHLGTAKGMNPRERGFDEYLGKHRNRGFFKKDLKLNGKPYKKEGYCTDLLTDEAIRMMNDDKAKPFFMFLAYFAPHAPLQAKKEEIKKANGNVYHAMIQTVDQNVGRIIKQLKKDGRYENTIIWFMSDNGGTVKQASNRPLNGKKGLKFEGGQRVPFVLSWPKKIKGGQKFHGLTSVFDIFATNLKAIGGKQPPVKLDGVNLLPYVTGKKKRNPHDILFWRKLEGAAVRMGDWKLIRTEGLEPMLYNLRDDKSERKVLTASNPEKVEELLKRLESWEKGLMDPLWKEGKKYIEIRKKDYEKFRDAKDFIPIR